MSLIPLPLERLLRMVGRLPGLGPRSAQRVVLHLLTRPETLHDVVSQLADVGSQVRACNRCFATSCRFARQLRPLSF